MKYPFTLKVAYIGSDCLPINTVDSTHYISCSDDVDVLVGYINTFSSNDWSDTELMTAISLSCHSFCSRTEQDTGLFLIVL